MAPKTSDHHSTLEDSKDFMSLDASPVSVLYKRVCPVPSFSLGQPLVTSSGQVVEYTELTDELRKLTARVESMTERLSSADTENSLVLSACAKSLRTAGQVVLRQASLLIDCIDEDSSESSKMVSRLRSALALVRANQFLDVVGSAVSFSDIESLNKRLADVLNDVKGQAAHDGFENMGLTVSPWMNSTLAFDILAGQPATRSLEAGRDRLPFHVEVEPVFELRADELIGGNINTKRLAVCSVEIESCSHRALPFAGGAGNIGEATIRVRVAPIAPVEVSSSKTLGVWGVGSETQRPLIQEARAFQDNAYPPKPRSNVDVYTSCEYGDAALTVTLVLKTCETKNAERPNLHVELFLLASAFE